MLQPQPPVHLPGFSAGLAPGGSSLPLGALSLWALPVLQPQPPAHLPGLLAGLAPGSSSLGPGVGGLQTLAPDPQMATHLLQQFALEAQHMRARHTTETTDVVARQSLEWRQLHIRQVVAACQEGKPALRMSAGGGPLAAATACVHGGGPPEPPAQPQPRAPWPGALGEGRRPAGGGLGELPTSAEAAGAVGAGGGGGGGRRSSADVRAAPVLSPASKRGDKRLRGGPAPAATAEELRREGTGQAGVSAPNGRAEARGLGTEAVAAGARGLAAAQSEAGSWGRADLGSWAAGRRRRRRAQRLYSRRQGPRGLGGGDCRRAARRSRGGGRHAVG